MTKQSPKPLKGMQDTPVFNKHKVTGVWHPIKNYQACKEAKNLNHNEDSNQPQSTDQEMI